MSSLWRPILEAIIKRPGQLYQPVYFSHLSDSEALATEIKRVAKGHDLNVFMGIDEWQRHGQGQGVIVVGEEDLVNASEQLVMPGIQLIGIGPEISRYPLETQGWLEKGLVVPSLVETTNLDLGDSDLDSLVSNLGAKSEGHFILVTEEDKAVGITQELRIRLEAANFEVVLAGGETGEGAKRVSLIRLSGVVDSRQALAQIQEHQNLPGIKITILGQAVWKQLCKTGAWSPVADSSETFRLDTLSALREEEEEQLWPQLSDILDSLPSFPERPVMPTTGWTEWKSNGDIELLSNIQSNSYHDLTVYYAEGCARIRIRNNQVVDIEMTGDRWSAEKLKIVREKAGRPDNTLDDCRYDLINDRIRRIVQWPRSTVVIAKATQARNVPKNGVSSQGLILDVTTWIDEHKSVAKHSLSTKWKKTGKPVWEAPDTVAQKVWEAADGQKTAWQIDDELGVGRETILHILGLLADKGFLANAGEGEPTPETLNALAICQALLASGLDMEAKAYLNERLRKADIGPSEKALLAALIAVSEGPAPALRLMEGAVKGSSKQEWLPRRMDLAILLIRAGKKAGSTWRDLHRDMKNQPDAMGKNWTIKQYAKWGEMAVRNKEWEMGREVVKALKDAGEPVSEALASKLGDRIENK